jgi:hypothetical protein
LVRTSRNADLRQEKTAEGKRRSAWSPNKVAVVLRVSVWSGMYPGTHVVVWNKKARNTIVTDPAFIEHPRRSKRFDRYMSA